MPGRPGVCVYGKSICLHVGKGRKGEKENKPHGPFYQVLIGLVNSFLSVLEICLPLPSGIHGFL